MQERLSSSVSSYNSKNRLERSAYSWDYKTEPMGFSSCNGNNRLTFFSHLPPAIKHSENGCYPW
jgi:hypothetical protein